jgi:hypothetical protein
MSTTSKYPPPPYDDDLPLPGALPPRCMQTDDPAEAELARRKLRSPQRRRLFSRRRKREQSPDNQRNDEPLTSTPIIAQGVNEIVTVNSLTAEEAQGDVDVYRWAVLYEVRTEIVP